MKTNSKVIVVIIAIFVISIASIIVYTNYRPITGQPKLVFTTGDNQIVEISQRSTALTIQRQDSSGSPITYGSLIVKLSSGSQTGRFFETLSSKASISEITIPDSQSSVPVYYSDPEVGTPILTAQVAGYIPANATITLRPSQYIAISYSYKIAESVIDKNGDPKVPNSEGIFLIVNMTIVNRGYHSAFPTDTTNLRPVANGKQDFAYVTFLSLSDWNWTLSISDGESYSGMIVFQVPKSLSDASFTLNYKTAVNFAYPYVVWSKIQ